VGSFYNGAVGATGGQVGSGDNQYLYNQTTAQLIDVREGTEAEPDTSINPAVKVSRTISITEAAITGDGVEQLSAINGVCIGTATCEVQTVGVSGMAYNPSPASADGATAGGNDACGIYGAAEIGGSGSGVAIGGFFAARANVADALGSAIEANVSNGTGSNHSASLTGFPTTSAVWINANGANRSATGIVLANAFGAQFDVGLHFNAQVNNALTGPTVTADIQSNSTAATSINIAGTHSAAAIQVAETAGGVYIGANNNLTGSKFKVELTSGTTTAAPAFAIFATGATNVHAMMANGSGQHAFQMSGGADNGLTGSAAGDLMLRILTASKSFHIGGTASTIEITNGNALGFFNVATPATKQTVTGSKGANAALTSLLTALAAYGLITDSSS
jgi:hypothetical protein